MSAQTLPDLVRFTGDALAARGALVEFGDGARALALLPSAVAESLGIAEVTRLSPVPETGGELCALGSPLLEQLVKANRESAPVAWTEVDADAPRATQAAALAARFVVRNGVFEVGGTQVARHRYLLVAMACVAEADDRQEAMLTCTLRADDGAVPDGGIADIDLQHLPPWLRPVSGPAELHAPALSLLPGRFDALVRARVAPFATQVERRHRRDHERIVAYFQELVADAVRQRRGRDPAALRAKLDHFCAERDKKLRDLIPRFTVQVRLTPACVLGVTIPTVDVAVLVRRRKAERTLTMRLPAMARGLDRVACEGCGEPAPRPALCDEQLHILCEVCVPQAQGRIACRVCSSQ